MFKLINKIFSLFMICVIVLTTGFGYARYIESYDYRTRQETVATPLISAGSEVKILIISDTHFSKWYTPENFSEAVGSINEIQADYVLFLGDLFDYLENYSGSVPEISRCLGLIQAKKGKYAVFGNHDYGGGAEFKYEDIMAAGGFTVLRNSSQLLQEDNINLIGLDDMLIGYGDAGCAGDLAREGCLNLLMCHEPDVADQILNYNVNLMVSGHTHGGQVNLPKITDMLLPTYGTKYVKGVYDFGNAAATKLIVTSGLGMTKLPLRFLSPPDITLITLKGI